jgi:hypothetical protein
MSAEQIVCMSLLFVVGFNNAKVAKAINSNHHTVKKWRALLSAEFSFVPKIISKI